MTSWFPEILPVSNHRPQGLLSFFRGINLAIHTSISIYIIYQGSVWIWCQRIQRMMIVMIIFKHQRPRTSPMRPSRPPGCIETRWVAVRCDLFPIWSAAPAASGQRRNDDHSFWCCFQPILLVWELIYIIWAHLSLRHWMSLPCLRDTISLLHNMHTCWLVQPYLIPYCLVDKAAFCCSEFAFFSHNSRQ